MLCAMKLLITQITKLNEVGDILRNFNKCFQQWKMFSSIKYAFSVFLDKSNRYKEKIVVLTS